MKIVIMGAGKVGRKLAQQLAQENHDIVVIDMDGEALAPIVNNEDVMCIEGNCVDYDVQMEAGIPKTDLVIACTDKDELNMLGCLLAKKHGAGKTIARVRSPEYYDQLPYLAEEMGMSMAINPERAAADFASRVLIFPAANNIETFARGRVELIEFSLEKGNPLIGLSLMQIHQRYNCHVLICAIAREEKVFIPTGTDDLQEGDRIYVTSSHQDIQEFFKKIDIFRSSVRTVMIVGGGKVGYYLAQNLIKHGMEVKIIEQDLERCRDLCDRLPQLTVIHGDGSSQSLLSEEGIENADAFAALTGIDEINIILGLYARTKKVGKIITKVTQINFNELFEKIGIECIISPKAVTANMILSYIRALHNSADSPVESLSFLVDGQVEALEFLIEESLPFKGIPLKDLHITPGCLVASIVRDNKVIIPGGSHCMETGDSVIIVTTKTHLQSLHQIFSV